MSKIALNANIRLSDCNKAAKKLRKAGNLPGIIYGAGKDPKPIHILMYDFQQAYKQKNFFSSVFELNGVEEDGVKFIVKDVQYHPVSDAPIHVDFMRIAKGRKVSVKVALHFVNHEKSPGLKRGGVLNVLAHDIEVLTDPDMIPESIDVDMTGAEFHHSIHAYDLKLPDGVSLPVNAKNFTVATVVAPTIVQDQPSDEGGNE